MDENLSVPRLHGGQCADNTAEYAVFIADVCFLQSLHAVSLLMPADDGIKIFVSRIEVAECGMIKALSDRFED